MNGDYIKYLETKTVDFAEYRSRLETLVLLTICYQNTFGGIRLGESWLEANGADIIKEIKASGGVERTAQALIKFGREKDRRTKKQTARKGR